MIKAINDSSNRQRKLKKHNKVTNHLSIHAIDLHQAINYKEDYSFTCAFKSFWL